jgi:hypothetical protein
LMAMGKGDCATDLGCYCKSESQACSQVRVMSAARTVIVKFRKRRADSWLAVTHPGYVFVVTGSTAAVPVPDPGQTWAAQMSSIFLLKRQDHAGVSFTGI